MLYITAVRLSQGGTRAAHITNVKWLNSGDGTTNDCNTAVMVDYINKRNPVEVAGPNGPIRVTVVNANLPYIRTNEDNTTRDNLLSLPRF